MIPSVFFVVMLNLSALVVLMYKRSLPACKNATKLFDHNDRSRENEAHSTIEQRYNQLDDPVLKELFLLCGITVRRNRIYLEDLFKYSVGLSLFKNVHTVEHMRNAFYSKVEKLKDFSLLLDGEDDDTCVRMDGIVCDAARHIALRDHHMLSAWEHGGIDQNDRKGWPNKDFTEKCTAISLPAADIIPEVLQCPALKMFLLQHDGRYNDSVKILPRFFEEMKQLKVLSLEYMPIPSLPSSLQFLNKLQTLCLHRCGLGDVSLVGQLNNLEVLSFKSSCVEELPKEIGQLTRLRLLDLSKCHSLGVISPGVISSLERLEELRMGSFMNWEEAAGDRSNASLLELKHLSQLTALEVLVPDVDILPADFLSHELKRFKIMIGDAWFRYCNYGTNLNTLALELTPASRFQWDRGLIKLLKICDDLSLYGTASLNYILYHLDSQDCPQLRNLRLEAYHHVDFAHISNKVLMFLNLSSLVVHRCYGLRFMLSSSMARSLIQLKHLEITECEMMEEIVSTKQYGGEITGNMFPQLQHLQLIGLPNLAKFCSASYIEFPSLKRLQLEECAKLETFISHPLTKNVAIDNEIEEEDSKENPQTVVKYHLFDKKVSFPNLETLIMDGLPKFRTIWHNQLPQDSFYRLKNVKVQKCNSLINIFATSVMDRLNVLSTLYIRSCESLQVVFEIEDIEVKDSYGRISAATQLKSLYCQNLDSVYMKRCGNLTNIFPASVARDDRQLIQKLTVDDCGILEEFVAKGQGLRTLVPKFVFPKLHTQVCLPPLSHFPQLDQTLDGSKRSVLKTLMFSDHGQVEIFSAEFSSFQKIHELDRLSTIQHSFLLIEEVMLSHLTSLIVHQCDDLRFLLSSSMAKSLVQLKYLQVSKCEIMEEIILTSGYGEKNMNNMFSKLENMELINLPCLARFCSGSYIEFPSLKRLQLEKCTKLETSFISYPLRKSITIDKEIEERDMEENLETVVPYFLFDKKVGFPKLERMIIHRCHGLSFLLSSDMAGTLVQLKDVEISECQIMKEIVFLEQCSEANINMLPKLKHLVLNDLPHLTRFCSRSHIEFPSLEILHLEKCTKLETFMEVFLEECSEANMDMLPKLKHLVLNDLPNLTRFFSGSHIEFPSLEILHLEKCTKLETFIFYPLRKSIAIDKEIEETVHLFGKKVGFPKLERLTINDLPKLTKIWGSQLSENSFGKLRDITVQQCSNLINILPDSIIGVFQQLQKLTVENCGVLEEIVAQEEGATLMPDQFVLFPEVTCLEFKSLPQLKRFYPRMHALNWPLLKTLELIDCRIADIFASGFSGLPKTPDLGDPHNPIKQPSVLIEKSSFPNLEELTLGRMDIWYGHPAPAAFYKQAVFPGISSSDIDKTMPHLKTLRLHGMEKLMRLWEENTKPAGPGFLQLETLEVKFCGLNNIELSTISFKNLTNLEVSFCWRLQYLTTYSVARSLRQLKKLKVDECKSMKEILANDGVGEDASIPEIVFNQLQHLELSDLISLEWFCSRNCIVKVPLLETSALVVNWCPLKLKISSNKTLKEVDSNVHLNVQKSHSRKEEAGATTEAAGSLETNQRQPSLNASESEHGVEAVIQETAINSQNMEHAKVMELNQKQVVTNTSKNLQEADFGMQESILMQPLNLGSNEQQFQFQADSKLEAEIRHLQELLRTNEAENRRLQDLLRTNEAENRQSHELLRAKVAVMRDKEQKLAEERLASVDPKGIG